MDIFEAINFADCWTGLQEQLKYVYVDTFPAIYFHRFLLLAIEYHLRE